MRILITGASGFIGSHLVEGALERGHEVWAGVRETSSRRYLTDSRIHFIMLDLNDIVRLTEQLENAGEFDVIIHAAGVIACSHPKQFHEGNAVTTANLTSVCRTRRFIYLSTLGTFGPVREERPFTPILESDAQCPDTAYGKSKLEAEKAVMASGLKYVIFRPTGVYGPREHDYYKLARSVKMRFDFIAGFGSQSITFLYVKDLVNAVFLAVDKGVSDKTYFVSDGGTYSSRDFSLSVAQELGHRWTFHIKVPMFLLWTASALVGGITSAFGKSSTLNLDKYRILRQRNWQCDITALQRDLGYKPEWPLQRGVSETVASYKADGLI